MELLIAMLMYLGVIATPDMMNDADFCAANQQEINQAQDMMASGHYESRDGVVITSGSYPVK